MSKYLLALVSATGFLTACTDSPDDPVTEPPPDVVETVEVGGSLQDLAPGDQLQLTAWAFDADGGLVTGRTFAWQSDAPAVATVTSDGLVTAVGAGEVTISATTGFVTGGVFLTVIEDVAPAVAWVELSQSGEVDLAVGATVELVATAYAADGEILLDRTFTWQTENADVATVSDDGVVTAVAPGSAGIRVICESQRADLLVRVPDVVDPVSGFTLTAVGGSALPALLGTFTNSGGTATSTVRLHDGWLAINHLRQTYEGAVQGLITTQNQASWVPVPIFYETFGAVIWDATTSEFVFTPLDGSASFTATWVATGLQVRWQPDARMAGPSTFLFTED